ncbi:hypothetical protein LCGC14_0606070 [marine sediment metagenome]|uniref:Uncharacterized protein n=1 Tax=marine sediment metagenome TaxID=412755 RepID=A0A0F9R9A8_9ZZZZ
MSGTKTDRTKEALRSMTQKSAAWLFGIDARTMRTAAWKDAPRNKDGKTYNAQALVVWRREVEAEAAGTDPLSAGGDSPALERFRNARADREELELSVRREQLVNVDEFLAWWDAEVVTSIRKKLERLARKYDQAAVDLVTSGLEQAGKAVSQRFGG